MNKKKKKCGLPLNRWLSVSSRLLLIVCCWCVACGKNTNDSVSKEETQVAELTEEERQEARMDYLRDSISRCYSVAHETKEKVFYFKGKQKRYKPFLYIYDLQSEKSDSLKVDYPSICDFRSIGDNRIVMIEQKKREGEGMTGLFFNPPFFVLEYNLKSDKIQPLDLICAFAEFVDSFNKKTGENEVLLNVEEVVCMNPEEFSGFDIVSRTINLTTNTTVAGGKRPIVDLEEAVFGEDGDMQRQLANARKLFKECNENLTIDEMVDLSFIFWEFGNRQEKETSVVLMKTAVRKNKKHVQERLYGQSELEWGMPGTPEQPDWLPQP